MQSLIKFQNRDKEEEKKRERIRLAERNKKMYFYFIGKKRFCNKQKEKRTFCMVKVAIVQFFRELTGAREIQSFTFFKIQVDSFEKTEILTD